MRAEGLSLSKVCFFACFDLVFLQNTFSTKVCTFCRQHHQQIIMLVEITSLVSMSSDELYNGLLNSSKSRSDDRNLCKVPKKDRSGWHIYIYISLGIPICNKRSI